jgi:U3 small nucleolar RNA-associated protein 15
MSTTVDEWKLPVRRVLTHKSGEQNVIWNSSELTYEQTMFGQVSALSYSPKGNFIGAVSSNQLMLLRQPASEGSVWNEQHPRSCFSIRFRHDAKLVLQTIERRVVIRSTETAFERRLQGHTRDVRDAVFLSTQVFASCSDDTTVRFWDITRENELGVAQGHTDYVRTIQRLSENVVLSGGYDRVVNMWDVRVSLEAPVGALSVGHPVEQVRCVTDDLAVCAAGDLAILFDVRNFSSNSFAKRGNTVGAAAVAPAVQQQLSVHTKTVTSIGYSTPHATLVTASLDGRVKFLTRKDGGDFTVDTTRKYGAAVTAFDLHPDGTEFAVGLATGRLETHRLKELTQAQRVEDNTAATAEKDQRVLEEKLQHTRKLLSVYQYHRALRVALYSRMPDVIVTTLEEMQRRSVLRVALSGHNDRTIVQIMRFAVQHLDVPQVGAVCLATLDVIFEIYGAVAAKSAFFHRELLRAHKRVGEILGRLEHISQCVGMLELVVDEASEAQRQQTSS